MEKKKVKLEELRSQMTRVNEKIMHHLNEFFEISNHIGHIKDEMGLPHFDPVRESEMLSEIRSKNKGPMPYDLMKRIFKDIFRASVEEMGVGTRKKLEVNRLPDSEALVIVVKVRMIQLTVMTHQGDLILGIGAPVAVGHVDVAILGGCLKEIVRWTNSLPGWKK